MPGILGRFRTLRRPQFYISFSPDAPASVLNYSVKKLYQTQDNLRAVIDFLSASIAQLPIKVYHRNADDSRTRDRDSKAAKLLHRPNIVQTTYEFIRGLVTEYFVFGNVYVWVISFAVDSHMVMPPLTSQCSHSPSSAAPSAQQVACLS